MRNGFFRRCLDDKQARAVVSATYIIFKWSQALQDTMNMKCRLLDVRTRVLNAKSHGGQVLIKKYWKKAVMWVRGKIKMTCVCVCVCVVEGGGSARSGARSSNTISAYQCCGRGCADSYPPPNYSAESFPVARQI